MERKEWNVKEIADNFKTNEKEHIRVFGDKSLIMVRLDMRGGGRFVKGLKKPFDDNFTNAMTVTLTHLVNNIDGVVFGYTGSDEITLVLMKRPSAKNFAPFFNGKDYKMLSLIASEATLAFNKAWMDAYGDDEDYNLTLQRKRFQATFDARLLTYNLSDEDTLVKALTMLQSRVLDVKRNAIGMIANCHFSHKQLQKVSVCDQRVMLEKKGVDLTQFRVENLLGTLLYKADTLFETIDRKTGERVMVTRSKWHAVTYLESFANASSEKELLEQPFVAHFKGEV